ncbi:uncharacterized protein [Miscanthus floridulus]|uniref:uncharacterized protein n=1 Tax=Miscanthus floridulus TaxID=154761 RepID=UPI00345B2FBC
MDRSKKSNKNNKKFEDLKNLPCPFHKNAKHTATECRQLQELGFYGKSNKGKEFIKFEVADFESSYHAIFGPPALAKFMAVPHYPYLLLKMSGPNGVLSFQGDLKRSYDYDMEAIQIAARAQQAYEAQEIANLAQKTKPEDMEILIKKAGIIAPPSKMDTIKIDLGTSDPSKTAIIGAHLSKE